MVRTHRIVAEVLSDDNRALLNDQCAPEVQNESPSKRFGIFTLVWVVVGYFGLFDLGIGLNFSVAIDGSPQMVYCRLYNQDTRMKFIEGNIL